MLKQLQLYEDLCITVTSHQYPSTIQSLPITIIFLCTLNLS